MHRTKIRETTEICTTYLICAELEPLERVASACMLMRTLVRSALRYSFTEADCQRAVDIAHTWSAEDEALRTKKEKAVPDETTAPPTCSVQSHCTEGPEDQWFQVVEAHTNVTTHFCPRHALCAELLVSVMGHLGSECPELIRLVERGHS